MSALVRRLSICLFPAASRPPRLPSISYAIGIRSLPPGSPPHFFRRPIGSAAMSTYTPPAASSASHSAATADGYLPTFTAALIQLNCQADMQHNLRQATALIRQAAAAGAQLICTPENTTRLTSLTQPFDIQTEGRYESQHPIIPEYRRLAAELNVWLAIGSVGVRAEDDTSKMANRSLLISPHTTADEPSLGTIVARYDKAHMFDAPSLTNSATDTYVESARIRPGRTVPVVLTPFGPIALTICYDLRFPTLYSRLATLHAPTVVLIPSAFTVPTGEAHWVPLLRARAIECGCYVLAAAQCGEHTGGRKTYGHSMAVGPWGNVEAVRKEATEGVLLVNIDRRQVDEARTRIPSLRNQREFEVVVVDARVGQRESNKVEVREEKSAATPSAL